MLPSEDGGRLKATNSSAAVLVVIALVLVMSSYRSVPVHSVFAQTYSNSIKPVWPRGMASSPEGPTTCTKSNWYQGAGNASYQDWTCKWYDYNLQWSQTCTMWFYLYLEGGGYVSNGCSNKEEVHYGLLNGTTGLNPPSAGLLNGALNPSNATSTTKAGSSSPIVPPVSIIKLPPGTTTSAPTTSTAKNSNGPVAGGTTAVKVPPGVFKPTGNITGVLPTGNNTATTPPPVNIIKAPPGMTSPTGTAANPSNGSKTTMAESSGGGGETETCLPGQTANTELGTCQDPVCGPGQVRDPTGQTRYCVNMTCPPGENFNTDINQCVVNPIPPPPKCPDGTVGTIIHERNGITLVECPKSLPTATFPLGGVVKVPPGAIKAFPTTGNNTNSSIARLGVYSPTGGCSTTSRDKCVPCDPGIPGASCIPSRDWPQGVGTGTLPPNIAAPTGNNTSIISKLPPSAFKPTGNLTSALPTGNSTTVTLPPGSILKVPPGTTNLQPTGNNTGTLPALTVTTEHNPASPNVSSLAKNTTNPSNNNTSTLKLSPLTSQNQPTSGQHHKGSSTSSSSSNTNSTGH